MRGLISLKSVQQRSPHPRDRFPAKPFDYRSCGTAESQARNHLRAEITHPPVPVPGPLAQDLVGDLAAAPQDEFMVGGSPQFRPFDCFVGNHRVRRIADLLQLAVFAKFVCDQLLDRPAIAGPDSRGRNTARAEGGGLELLPGETALAHVVPQGGGGPARVTPPRESAENRAVVAEHRIRRHPLRKIAADLRIECLDEIAVLFETGKEKGGRIVKVSGVFHPFHKAGSHGFRPGGNVAQAPAAHLRGFGEFNGLREKRLLTVVSGGQQIFQRLLSRERVPAQ